jgi:hypothetical protein
MSHHTFIPTEKLEKILAEINDETRPITIDEQINLVYAYLNSRKRELPPDANDLARQIFESDPWQLENRRQLRVLTAILETLRNLKSELHGD